jgi:signal transduction histidine kinase
MSHELNNSLAPISSLLHSARLIAQRPEHLDKLERVFATLEERTQRLHQFLEGYARLARLPRPRPVEVSWARFFEGLRALFPAVSFGPLPEAPGYFDPAQLEQVLLNLLKNAVEAGSAAGAVHVQVQPSEGGWRVCVEDRGRGLSAEVLEHALLPFYSTKEKGSGLGLALCREIIEAHGGRLWLENREGGGARVSCWLPGSQRPVGLSSRVKLTLTRG